MGFHPNSNTLEIAANQQFHPNSNTNSKTVGFHQFHPNSNKKKKDETDEISFKMADESRTKGDPVMADEGANILLSKTVPP